MIASGNNGYSAGAGYNLVTGLGTPVASFLVPDLVAFQGPDTTYSGSTVGALPSSGLVTSGSTVSGANQVFSVFDSITVTADAFTSPQGPVFGLGLASPANEMPSRSGGGGNPAIQPIGAGIHFGQAISQCPGGPAPSMPAGVAIIPVPTGRPPQPTRLVDGSDRVERPTRIRAFCRGRASRSRSRRHPGHHETSKRPVDRFGFERSGRRCGPAAHGPGG